MKALRILLLALAALAFGCPAPEPQKLGASPIVYDPIALLGLPTAGQKTTYAATANWYVSASGSTTATGTDVSHPITPAELSRRLNGLTLTVSGEMLVTFDAAGDPNNEFVVTWNTQSGTQTRLKGTPASVLTGTVTTWRNKAPATNVPHGVTDTALGSANAWTAQVGRRIRDTQSGARQNAVAWIAKDEGSKTARISPPYKGSSAYPFSTFGYVLTPFVANDSYAVETLPVIGGLNVTGHHNSTSADGDFGARIIVEDIAITNPILNLAGSNALIAFVNSQVDYPWNDATHALFFLGCSTTNATIWAGTVYYNGCLFKNGGNLSLNAGATVNISDGLFQNAFLQTQGQGYVYVNADVGLFDYNGQVVQGLGGANYLITDNTTLFGSGNTYGVKLNDTSALHWGNTRPVITGSSGDAIVDGLTVAWTATPYIDRFTGSALYQSGTGGGRPQPIQTFSIATSASSVGEGVVGRLSGSGTITKVIFVPNAASTPASGSNSQAMVVGIGNGSGGARSQVAAASIANATPTAAFTNFDMGSITNGSFTDGQILTFKTTLTGTATLPAGLLVVVTK